MKAAKPKNKTTSTKGLSLRQRAERRLSEQKEVLREISTSELKKLLHELGTHQIKLEMQNEELRQMQAMLETSRNNYADLYDFAPIGYCTVDRSGLIRDINITAAALLGRERQSLVNNPFATYIEKEARNAFRMHLSAVLESGTKQSIELRLKGKGTAGFYALLESVVVKDAAGRSNVIRLAVSDISARKNTEEALKKAYETLELQVAERTAALRESERRERERAEELAIMLEAVPTPVIIVHDPDSTHMTGNRAADELLRLPHRAEISLSAPEAKPGHFRAVKDGRELRLDELPAQRAARGEHVQDFEFSLVFNDGTDRHLLGYGSPLLNDRGRPRGAVHVLVDITERKRAEESLRKSEEKFRSLFDNMIDGFAYHRIILNDQGVPVDYLFLEANSAFERLTGLNRGDIVGKRVREVLPGIENDPADWIGLYGKVALTGTEARFEQHSALMDKWFSVTAYSPQKDHFVTIFEDITERKRVVLSLQQSREDMNRAQEVGQIGSWRLDVRRNILAWSDENYRIFGVPRDTPLSYESFLETVHPDDRAFVDSRWKAALDGEPYDIEHRIVVDGRVKWVREKAYLEFDKDHALTSGFGITQDITARKRLDDVQAFLAQTDSGNHDTPFFNTLAHYLAASLGMDFVCIDRLEGDGLTARTVAVWSDGHFEDNVTYALKDTPCGEVVGKSVCCFPASVCQFFPRDGVLKELRAESYIGATLWGHRGQPIGLIAVIGRRPLENRPMAESILKMAAARAAGEMERVEGEEALRKLNVELEHRVQQRTRFYAVLAGINEAIVRRRDQQSLFEEVCDIIVHTGGFRLAWVGLVDPQSRAIRPVASCGVTAYLDGLTVVAADVPEGRGPTGRSVREKRFIVNLDFETDENMALWRERARAHGIRSSSAFPLMKSGAVIGALTFYSGEPSFFTDEEVSLLQALTDDLGYALEAIALERENKDAAEILRRTSAEIQDLYNNAPCGYHSLDRDGVIIRINDTELGWLGVSREETEGKKKITDFYTPEGVTVFKRTYPQFVRQGSVANLEFDVVRRDGSLFPVLISGTALRDKNGNFVMSRSTMVDMTERKKAETEALRLIAAVEAAADAVVITEPAEGRIQYVNSAFELITGFSRSDAVGETLHILDSGRHDDQFFSALREDLKRNGMWHGRIVSKKKDGTLRFEDRTCSPVRDASGRIINYVTVMRDVTERIRLEAVAESVSQMDNIGAVFAGVRHEIGNPINNAKMGLSVLRQKLDNMPAERVRDYVDRTLVEIGRVEHLLTTLRTFNLFETPVLEDVPIGPLLDLFLGLVQKDLEARGITLSTQVLSGAELVRANARALHHVLLNVTTNAADALNNRTPSHIDIMFSRENDRVRIRISDNGCGMKMDQLANLFKPFNTTKPHGTGLGLVIVKKMLTSMNGTIEIESHWGSGTIVNIYLPGVPYAENS